MGTNFAPEYAYMVYWAVEKRVFKEIQLNTRPRRLSTEFGIVKYYGRYIDDLFLVLEVSQESQESRKWEENVKKVFNNLGELILDEVSIGDQIPYLDTLITLTNDGIEVAPYAKASTTFLYTPPFSMHHPTSIVAWTSNELRRILLLSSNHDVYINKICDFINHLKLRGYPLSFLKWLRDHVIHHRYRREMLWEGKRNKTNPFPIIIPFCSEIGIYNPTKMMELAKRKVMVTNSMVNQWRFVAAWKRKPNLSETLRIRHKELVVERKRKRDEPQTM
jgi:hypothetical protein